MSFRPLPFAAIVVAWLSLISVGLWPGFARAQGPSTPPPRTLSLGPASTPRITAELVPMTTWAVPGSTLVVAVRQQIQPGWHTYWRNPGDSGGPTELSWTLPRGTVAGDIVWPVPERLRLQDLMNYGYSGQVYLPVPIQIPPTAQPGSRLGLQTRALFLVCSDEMCVPDTLDLALEIPVQASAPPLEARHGQAIAETLAAAPRPAGISATLQWNGSRLQLSASGGPLAGRNPGQVWFFPFEGGQIDHAAGQDGRWGPQGLRLNLTPAAQRQGDHSTLEPLAGILATEQGAYEIRTVLGPSLPGTDDNGALPPAEPASQAIDISLVRILQAALLAFIGGLILNLMPCVFPVLAMKVAALTRAAHDRAEVRRDGLAYMAGVVATFLVLALALIGLRAAGQSVGWGFQLQSPAVTAALALLMLAVGMNLSGVFHVGSRVQGMGQGPLARLPGWVGAFFTGGLAVVVAAPCTAPFMAVALGTALTLPGYWGLIIFAMLGLGLALPFVISSFSPGLLSRLPRPGAWMERLRRILALPMYGTAVWLGWVFSRQVLPNGVGWLVLAAFCLALALWLWGRIQTSGSRNSWMSPVAVACGALTVLGWSLATRHPAPVANPVATRQSVLPSDPWSREAVQTALAAGRPVLVNFTADWCVTCKINERTSLSSERVKAALDAAGTVYLVADWTRRDDRIAAELARHGRSGVPLYLLYTPGQTEPRILPQLLTEGVVLEALADARPSG